MSQNQGNSMQPLTQPAKLLLLAALLANDKIISDNAKCFLKEVILRHDANITRILQKFESKASKDASFLEDIHSVIKREAENVFSDLFIDTSIEVGKALSKRERDRRQLHTEKSLIYGEVEFSAFYDILRTINPQPGLVFYDLGSGTGKAVMAARLTQDFSKCIGIEILEDLYNQSQVIAERYEETFKGYLFAGGKQDVEIKGGSFLDTDWSDGDVIFANSTCFEDDLMRKMTSQAEKLKPGSIVVTFTKGMHSKAFEVIDKRRHKMSWGPATVFIHRKLNSNGKPVGPIRLNRLPSDTDYNGENLADFPINHGAITVDTDEDSEDIAPSQYNAMSTDHGDFRPDSPPMPTKDKSGMDIIGSPQDTALLRRKKMSHQTTQSQRSSSPPPPTVDEHGMALIGSPQDTALLRRKKIQNDSKPSQSQIPMPPTLRSESTDILEMMGSPQDAALLRRKRVTREGNTNDQRDSSPPPPIRDEHGNDIMSSPQGEALMRRKRVIRS